MVLWNWKRGHVSPSDLVSYSDVFGARKAHSGYVRQHLISHWHTWRLRTRDVELGGFPSMVVLWGLLLKVLASAFVSRRGNDLNNDQWSISSAREAPVVASTCVYVDSHKNVRHLQRSQAACPPFQLL